MTLYIILAIQISLSCIKLHNFNSLHQILSISKSAETIAVYQPVPTWVLTLQMY